MKKYPTLYHLKTQKSKYTCCSGSVQVLIKFYRTQFTQQATMTVGSFLSRWENTIEDFSIKRFQQNAQVGREGFLNVLEKFVAMAEAAKQGSNPVTAT